VTLLGLFCNAVIFSHHDPKADSCSSDCLL